MSTGVYLTGELPQADAQAKAGEGVGQVKLYSGGKLAGTWNAASIPIITEGTWDFNAVSKRADGAVIRRPVMVSGSVSFERRLTP
jgi:hypothetical protein